MTTYVKINVLETFSKQHQKLYRNLQHRVHLTPLVHIDYDVNYKYSIDCHQYGNCFFHNDKLDNDMEHETSHDIFECNVVISFHDKHEIPRIKVFFENLHNY